MPVALLALGMGFRQHRRPLGLWFGGFTVLIAYLHVFAGTPEWTMYLAAAGSLLAAAADWQASRASRLTRAA